MTLSYTSTAPYNTTITINGADENAVYFQISIKRNTDLKEVYFVEITDTSKYISSSLFTFKDPSDAYRITIEAFDSNGQFIDVVNATRTLTTEYEETEESEGYPSYLVLPRVSKGGCTSIPIIDVNGTKLTTYGTFNWEIVRETGLSTSVLIAKETQKNGWDIKIKDDKVVICSPNNTITLNDYYILKVKNNNEYIRVRFAMVDIEDICSTTPSNQVIINETTQCSFDIEIPELPSNVHFVKLKYKEVGAALWTTISEPLLEGDTYNLSGLKGNTEYEIVTECYGNDNVVDGQILKTSTLDFDNVNNVSVTYITDKDIKIIYPFYHPCLLNQSIRYRKNDSDVIGSFNVMETYTTQKINNTFVNIFNPSTRYEIIVTDTYLNATINSSPLYVITDCAKPIQPEIIKINKTSIEFKPPKTWDRVTHSVKWEETWLRVQLEVKNGSNWNVLDVILEDDETVVVSDLEPDTEYEFRYTAWSKYNHAISETSNIFTKNENNEIECYYPELPNIPTVTQSSGTSLRIAFPDLPLRGNTLKIKYTDNPKSGTWINVNYSSGIVTITSLSENTAYYFYVLCENDCGESYSETIVVKTPSIGSAITYGTPPIVNIESAGMKKLRIKSPTSNEDSGNTQKWPLNITKLILEVSENTENNNSPETKLWYTLRDNVMRDEIIIIEDDELLDGMNYNFRWVGIF